MQQQFVPASIQAPRRPLAGRDFMLRHYGYSDSFYATGKYDTPVRVKPVPLATDMLRPSKTYLEGSIFSGFDVRR